MTMQIQMIQTLILKKPRTRDGTACMRMAMEVPAIMENKVSPAARNLVLLYMAFMGMIFVFRPELILWGFSVKNPEIIQTAKIMLKFISCFLLFDGLFIVYSNAIRAAGDTLFSMLAGTSMAVLMQAVPAVVLGYFKVNVWIIWVCLVIYIMTAGTVFYLRYRGGKWTSMKVIEDGAFRKEGAAAS